MKKLSLIIGGLLLAGFSASAQSTHQSALRIKSKKGTNLHGIVECAGKPVPGVVVSDGYETTVTDKNGRYWLKSGKQNGQVFITTPSGYIAASSDAIPGFWADLDGNPATEERHDFLLEKTSDTNHAMIVITDPHFSNTRHDIRTFNEVVMPAINSAVAELKNDSTAVYTLCLGDSSWDRLWYNNDFPIGKFRELLSDVSYPTPLYNVMGNHDNDGSVQKGDSTDFLAAKPYMAVFGPRYYSFNAGGLHYVVMDDIVYKNEGKPRFGNENIAGSCNYDKYFTREQLDWLKKDLEHVSPETPVIIAAHIPVFKSKSNLGKEYTPGLDGNNVTELMEILKGHKEIHFLTGHTHYNTLCRIPSEEQTVIEHNIAGTCGAWWYTSCAGDRILTPNGNPAGFEIFKAEGPEISWKYVPFESDGAFTVYDINSVKDYYAKSGEVNIFRKHYPKWNDYSKDPENTVYIDVWAWDPAWTVKVTENGKELPLEHLSLESPTYLNTYMLWKTVWVEQYPDSYAKPRKVPMFRTVASAPDTNLEVTVTDCFGNEYKQTIVRPYEFSHKTW